jgi:multidrug efflux system membrane fusion protein
VVDKNDHVAYREITPGGLQGNLRVVKGGLQAGDRIVVNGTQRVRPNEQIKAHMVPMTGDGDANGAPVAQSPARAKAQKDS